MTIARTLIRLGLPTLAAAGGLAGCGINAVSGPVGVTVTRGFGQQPIAATSQRTLRPSATVTQVIAQHFPVRASAGVVTAIDGVGAGAGPSAWSVFVNGIAPQDKDLAGARPGRAVVHHGDQVWWDLHDGSAGPVPAVVGAYPEPFLHGVAGKRYPTVVECGPDDQSACDTVAAALKRVGVAAPSQLLGTGSGTDSLGIVVGTWAELQPLVVARLIAEGPGHSGVYIRFRAGVLQLLTAGGRAVGALGAGDGLVAATRDAVSEPVWLITGTDAAGVRAAAEALSVARLHDHFALAVHAGRDVPLPVSRG